MAIRFPCGACAQPIEVDDEWASKQVACPFCHETITAPNVSTLTDLSVVPMAQPADAPTFGDGNLYPPGARAESRNRLAIVAAVLVASSLFAFIGFAVVMSLHADEVKGVMERADALTSDGSSFMGAIQGAWTEFYEHNGGIPPDWMLGAILLEFGGFATWIAGLVCGIIACYRPRRRSLAISTLVVAALMPLLFCVVTGLAF